MKKSRWTDWIAALSVVLALGAYAAAEASEDLDGAAATQAGTR